MTETAKVKAERPKSSRLQSFRSDVQRVEVRARHQWEEFDVLLKEMDKLARGVSKVSRHALVNIVARFRAFRRAAQARRRAFPKTTRRGRLPGALVHRFKG